MKCFDAFCQLCAGFLLIGDISHVVVAGSCGQQGYRSNGSYVEGWHGVCGTGNPYYLLCSTCRDRYLTENRALSDSADCASRNIPYAKLLLMAPDLLGSSEKSEGNCDGWLFLFGGHFSQNCQKFENCSVRKLHFSDVQHWDQD